jgi:hypothetical protein
VSLTLAGLFYFWSQGNTMLDTPDKTEEHKPDGLNILSGLLQEIKTLRETVQAHEERLNNLTLNIPEQTLNAIMARTLDMHAQVLLAATRPAQATPTQEEPQEPLVEETGPSD